MAEVTACDPGGDPTQAWLPGTGTNAGAAASAITGGAAGNGGQSGAGGEGGQAGAAGGAMTAWWSCGQAAGVCTCVVVATDVGAMSRPCGSSDCCFLGRDESCSCLLAGAPLDCPALMATLGAQRRVASCPF